MLVVYLLLSLEVPYVLWSSVFWTHGIHRRVLRVVLLCFLRSILQFHSLRWTKTESLSILSSFGTPISPVPSEIARSCVGTPFTVPTSYGPFLLQRTWPYFDLSAIDCLSELHRRPVIPSHTISLDTSPEFVLESKVYINHPTSSFWWSNLQSPPWSLSFVHNWLVEEIRSETRPVKCV